MTMTLNLSSSVLDGGMSLILPSPKVIDNYVLYRVCPGEHIADTLLWAAMTAILATFDILPAVDPTTGCAVVTEPRFSTGTAR